MEENIIALSRRVIEMLMIIQMVTVRCPIFGRSLISDKMR